jgi:hypothetical protein
VEHNGEREVDIMMSIIVQTTHAPPPDVPPMVGFLGCQRIAVVQFVKKRPSFMRKSIIGTVLWGLCCSVLLLADDVSEKAER